MYERKNRQSSCTSIIDDGVSETRKLKDGCGIENIVLRRIK